MKVEIGTKSAARTIKVLLRALEIAEAQLKQQEKKINRLEFDNEHQAREISDLEAHLEDARHSRDDLQRQLEARKGGK